jgi:hypothetical protein
MATDPPPRSYLEVDRRFVEGDDSLRGEVASTPELADHLAALQRPVAVPAWVLALQEERPPVRARRWWLVVAALAALVVLWLGLPPPDAVRTKSPPALVVHVATPDGPVVWDDGPLPGDARFRVEVRGLSTAHFALVYTERAQPPEVLVAGSRDAAGLLTPAWSLDGEARDATLVLVGAERSLQGLPATEVLLEPELARYSLQ